MRVADKMTFDQVHRNLAKNRSEMSELQNQAATQKRVTKPSDDPVAASRTLTARVDLQGNQQFTKNLNYAKSFLEFTDQSLNELTEYIVRAKELAISQASDASANDQSRQVVATEIQQIYDQMIAIANRKLGDRFIFGGYRTGERPFSQDGKYQGDSGEMMVNTDKESFMAMNIPGSKVFLGEGLTGDGISHQTTKQPMNIEEFFKQQELKQQKEMQNTNSDLRQPTSIDASSEYASRSRGGVNLFAVIRNLEIALRTNDKELVQDSLESVDSALSQVVMARAQVGSRSMSLDNVLQTLEKAKVDNRIQISSLEDADVFQTISDMNKTESTLQATLQTSGKLIQPSLLDFLR